MTNKNEGVVTPKANHKNESEVSNGLLNGAMVLNAVFNDLIFGEGPKETKKINLNTQPEKAKKLLEKKAYQNER